LGVPIEDNGGIMEISETIKEARIKKGMTQQQLAI